METQQTKTIVKYSNRKLYDKNESKYTTLKEIADFLKTGQTIIVIDNETKQDITKQTLFTVLVDNELTHMTPLDIPVAEILKAGGLAQYVQGLKNE